MTEWLILGIYVLIIGIVDLFLLAIWKAMEDAKGRMHPGCAVVFLIVHIFWPIGLAVIWLISRQGR